MHSPPPHLCLCFTHGTSLRQWDRAGLFDREVALYLRLVEAGWRVSFVTYGDRRDLSYTRRLPGIEVLCNRHAMPPSLYRKLIPTLHRTALERCHVVKTNQTYGGDVARRIARRYRIPLVARCGYMLSEFAQRKRGVSSREASRFARLESRLWRDADRIVVTTEGMAETVRSRHPVLASRVVVIPNYVDTRRFAPLTRDPVAHARTAPRDEVDLLFIGRPDPQKNLPTLLEAVSRLPEVTLRVVGGGAIQPLLDARPALAGRVHLLGPIPHDELPELFRRARVYVLPSLYEGHPKTLIEAMAAGSAIVAAESPGITGVIDHLQTGVLSHPTADALADAIALLLSDGARRRRLGHAARRAAIERYCLDRIAQRERHTLRGVLPAGTAESEAPRSGSGPMRAAA